MKIESVGTSLLIKAQPIEQKTDSVVTKKANPLSSATKKKEIAKPIVIKSDEKSKLSSGGNIVKGDVYDISSKFIPMYEGRLHLCAFYDHTRYSIGYGTKSYKGECITEEEAIRRFKEALKWRVEIVQGKYPNLLPHQQSALVSLFYNCHSCFYNVGKTIENDDFIRRGMQKTKYAKGLNKRAKAEQDLFNLGVIY